MIGDYYFLAASLPPLQIGSAVDITFDEFINRVEINLSKRDFQKVVKIRQLIDIYNIRALLLEDEIDPRGNLSKKELDEALLIKAGLPDFVFDFLDRYQTVQEKIRNFSGVISAFLNYAIASSEGFTKRYFIFEREFRLITAALRAKQLGRDIVREMQFEEPSDPFIMQILAQRDSTQFEPPQEYSDLKELFQACGSDPWQRHKAFTEYKFRKMEEMQGMHPLSLDTILSYMVKLLLCEDWLALDKEKGNNTLQTVYIR
jgi:hypothetical protein